MPKHFKISVLGDGGWGTALALVSARKGQETLLWSAFPEYAKELDQKRDNYKFIPGVPIPKSIMITSRLDQAVQFGEILVLAVPAQFLRNILFKLKDYDLSKKIILSVAKGIEAKTLARPSEIIQSVLGKVNLAVLSGPSHAAEVARNVPTLVVAASQHKKVAEAVQEAFRDLRFRVYVQTDVDRKSTRLNSSHSSISYAVFCLKKNFSSQNERLPDDPSLERGATKVGYGLR